MPTYAIAAEIKTELAEKFAESQHIGYDTRYRGDYYAVDTDGDGLLDSVYHAEENRQWNPWSDSAVAVPASACFDHDGYDYAWGDDGNDDGELAASFALQGMLEQVEVADDGE
jgi:hypothetical protein